MQLDLSVVAERIRQEIDVRTSQGYAVDGLAERRDELACLDRDALMAVHHRLQGLPLRRDWPYTEPADLESIRAARPEPVALPRFYLAEGEIRAKIHGAWLGRAAGCILGKPLEVHVTQDEIRAYLEGANALPLDDFIPAQSRDRRVLRRDCVPSMRRYVQYAQEDDDLNYMCWPSSCSSASAPTSAPWMWA